MESSIIKYRNLLNWQLLFAVELKILVSHDAKFQLRRKVYSRKDFNHFSVN